MAGLEGMDEIDEVQNYRPVSGLAVAAAVFGALSALTIFSPIFWFIPLLGLIVSVIALRDLARLETLKVGRLAAIAGLALSIGFGFQAMASKWVARQIMFSRVSRAVSIWVDAIHDERIMDARGMMSPLILPAPERLGEGEDARYVNDPVAQAAAFRNTAAVKAILGCKNADADLIEAVHRPETQESREAWIAQLRFSPCDDGKSLLFRLELQPTLRRNATGIVEHWEITKVEFVGPGNAPMANGRLND